MSNAVFSYIQRQCEFVFSNCASFRRPHFGTLISEDQIGFNLLRGIEESEGIINSSHKPQ